MWEAEKALDLEEETAGRKNSKKQSSASSKSRKKSDKTKKESVKENGEAGSSSSSDARRYLVIDENPRMVEFDQDREQRQGYFFPGTQQPENLLNAIFSPGAPFG